MTINVCVAALVAATPVGVAVAATSTVAGDWAITSEVVLHIAPCPGSHDRFCGTLTAWPKGDDGQATLDTQNPDARLAQRPLIGLRAMTSLRESGAGQWSGVGYNPEDGRTYNITLAPQPNGVLKAQFCLMKRCMTQLWKPAD